jgi:hypothetical protein
MSGNPLIDFGKASITRKLLMHEDGRLRDGRLSLRQSGFHLFKDVANENR